MSAVDAPSTIPAIDLEASVYRNKRPNIIAGADISKLESGKRLDFFGCREVLIGEIWRNQFDEGSGLLHGPKPWIGLAQASELSPEDLRVYHATVGVLGALLAPKDMECVEPFIAKFRLNETPFMAYGGHPAWTLHPAIASMQLYGLRLAYFILNGDMRDKFLDVFPHRGARIAGAIRRKDTEYLLGILGAIETGVRNINLDWEGMNRDDRYWEIVHSLVDANRKNCYGDLFELYDRTEWRNYNGTLSWWFSVGSGAFGRYDEWDDPRDAPDYDPDEDNEDDDGY